VVEPIEEFTAHLSKKHVIINLDRVQNTEEIFQFDRNYFVCHFCDKRKKISEMVGHYIFYHNFSVKMMTKVLLKYPQIQIEGANLNPINHKKESPRKKVEEEVVCQICNKEFSKVAPKPLHDVFCLGSSVCDNCEGTFSSPNQLSNHKDSEHISILCKFGCKKSLKFDQLESHVRQIHDIEECNLCGIVNSSNRISTHLKDQHQLVDLESYQKRKLYRVDDEKVWCNFCNNDITSLMGDLTITIHHYQSIHDVSLEALLRNLDRNPTLSNKVLENGDLNGESLMGEPEENVDHYIENFTVQRIPNINESIMIKDFDTSLVYCVGFENSDDEEIDPLKSAEVEPNPNQTQGDKKFECEFCSYRFQTRHFLYDHLKKKHEFKLIHANPRCSPCEINFATFQTFNKHLKRLHKTGKVGRKSLKCPFCSNVEFARKRERENHMFSQHPQEIEAIPCSGEIFGCHTCQFCKQKFWTSKQKSAHQLTFHKDQLNEVLLVCPIDNVEFVSKVYLQSHWKSHNVEIENEKIIYKCLRCHFVYSEMNQLREHMAKLHPEAEQNYCSICRFRLPNESVLIDHLKEKHPSKVKLQEQYSCNLCEKTYNKKSGAIVHYKQQHGAGNGIGIESGSGSGDVNVNMIPGGSGMVTSKSSSRGFKCVLCEKEFRTKDDRKLHYATEHKDEKIYKCQDCPLSFRNHSSLFTHRVLHKEIIMTCEYCQKTFSR
jgi:hypothetical protein